MAMDTYPEDLERKIRRQVESLDIPSWAVGYASKYSE
jgi:hypothetical protein